MDASLLQGVQTTIANGGLILFNNIRNQKGSISYVLGSGQFVISQTGYYLVNFWVGTNGTESSSTITLDLRLNGVAVSQACTPIVTGQVMGTALVAVTTVSSTLTVVNNTGTVVSLAPTQVQAEITITRVASI